MPDLVDKVAQAIDPNYEQTPDWRGLTARAAIAAVLDDLTDHSPEMWAAGVQAFNDPANRHGNVLGEVFNAMLAAKRRECGLGLQADA